MPVELVIDHSIQVDVFGEPRAFQRNAELEFERNRERYAFLRWGQEAFDNFAVVPPNTGICHQVNLEYLANVVHARDGQAFPDTLVGTDSHTTMINGLGVLGWGVGGIEAEAAMLGQPVSMLIPEVVGFRLTGELPEGATATDLVLTVTQMLRQRRVVSKFVEFYGPGLTNLPLADRATIGNMSPEYGATCGIFPVDAETLRYLRFTGRPAEQVELVEAYCRAQGLFHEPGAPEPVFSDTLELDLATVEPSLAGPRRPQDRVALSDAASDFREELRTFVSGEAYQGWDTAAALTFPASDPPSSKAEGVSPKPLPAHRGDGAPRRGPRRGPRPRRGRDRRDHELHEHVEPVGHARRRAAGPQGRRGRPDPAAVGEDEPRTRVEGRHRVPGARGADRAARAARLLARRLRLHDVHRQLRAAAGGDLARDRRARPHRLLGPVGQPQLRGTHPPRGQDELPRQPAARAWPTRWRGAWTSTSRASRCRATSAWPTSGRRGAR